ncbi:hypothetical protein BVRB_3g052170 isoform C [Beta vulgaris subsp. vulgaris]|nr:hypothetical protein BVRB_3g052170 isoform C [Beta vulgaris subsp. vulgaris]
MQFNEDVFRPSYSFCSWFVRKFGRGICNRKVLAGGHCANNG